MKALKILLIAVLAVFLIFFVATESNLNFNLKTGQKIDSLNGVAVYYNGGVTQSHGRNLSKNGYNLGIKYQCVEFVKRYYYQVYHHKMPEDRGNAKDFFNLKLRDGEWNAQRGLKQFRNGGSAKPEVGDLLVYSPTVLNRYGHVAIVSKVSTSEVEIIQQNAGPFSKSRETYGLIKTANSLKIENDRIYGWLRGENKISQNL